MVTCVTLASYHRLAWGMQADVQGLAQAWCGLANTITSSLMAFGA